MNHSYIVSFSRKSYFRLSITVIFLFMTVIAYGQTGFLPLSNPVQQLYEPFIYRVSSEMHTSVKPFLTKDVVANSPYDSLNTRQVKDTKFSRSWVGRKLFKEHLLDVVEDDYKLFLDPVFEFSAGHDQEYDKSFYTNSRGVWVGGSFGKRFSFNSTFYETQSQFPHYLDSTINITRIVPGLARIKEYDNSMDYAWATGVINFELNKHFTFQFGNDKNFIGDGYRSLLLSDNSFGFPYFKIVVDVWKIKYMNLFAVMRDLQPTFVNDNEPFDKKYGSFHYLDINIGKHVTFGLFEAVVWHSDSLGNRGFDLAYMNPIIFLRPIEFSLGSPDNALMGLNLKWKINSKNLLYAQAVLDEFLLDEVKAGNGWWGNKQGLQGGFKSFNVFNVKNLNLQGEVNYVRPFTYQHRVSQGAYAQYRQALAHPLGANFIEALGFVNYKWKNFDFESRLSYTIIGYDTAGLNFGQNVFKSYETHYLEYGNKVGQGEKHEIIWAELTINYLLNPVSRFSIFLQTSLRSDAWEGNKINTVIVQGGIHTRLFNRYFDF